MTPPGFFTRWGLAVVAPEAALVLADDPKVAGRGGTDLMRAIALLLVVAHLRELVAGGWVAFQVGFDASAPAFLGALSGAATFTLVFVVLATLAVSSAAGQRREFGRDFDLASVAALAPVTVNLVAALWAGVVAPLDSGGRILVVVAALTWGGILVALATSVARERVS